MYKPPRVVYWNNIPTPYMVERFNAVATRGNLSFEAWFNARLEPGRSWDVDESQWRFRSQYLPSIETRGRTIVAPLPLLRGGLPEVLVSLYAEPSFLVGSQIARRRGVRTAYWCEVTFDRWVQRHAWKERVKRAIFPRADAVIVAGRQGKSFAMRYGASSDRIHFLPHMIDVRHFAGGRAAVMPDRDRLRAELGLCGITFIYVGRLWWGKGLDHLLDAFAALQRLTEVETSLLLVGDGPEEQRLRRRVREQGLRRVVFTGFKQKPELPPYFAAADAFVFPTLGDPYGLVVDEAMACSLPVISTDAAGEIRDRVFEGVNGFIVPADNSAALLAPMVRLTRDQHLRSRMAEASARIIAGHTPELWAENFETVIARVLSAPAARSVRHDLPIKPARRT